PEPVLILQVEPAELDEHVVQEAAAGTEQERPEDRDHDERCHPRQQQQRAKERPGPRLLIKQQREVQPAKEAPRHNAERPDETVLCRRPEERITEYRNVMLGADEI